MRDFVLRDRDHAERAGRERIADSLDHLGARCRAAARKLGAHQIAYARVADIGYGEIAPRALVRRAQPGDRLAAATGLGDEHSDGHPPPGLTPLPRIGDKAPAAPFGLP